MTGERIRFQPHVPVKMALVDVDGEPKDFGWGIEQVWFQTIDGRIFCAPRELAVRVYSMGIMPGEPFIVTKRHVPAPGRRNQTRTQWDLERAVDAAPIPARDPEEPTDLEDKLKASIENVKAAQKKPEAQSPTPAPPEPSRPTIVRSTRRKDEDNGQLSFPWEAELSRRSQALVDTYAKTLQYANEKHGNAVPRDDIRALVITIYIGMTNRRGGNSNVA